MKTSRILLPVLTGILIIAGWEALVRIADLPPYLLPAPSRIAQRLVEDWAVLWASLLVTLNIALLALLAAVLGGGLLAILFAQSRTLAASLFPYAVILQVTPIIAIAPLILIYVKSTEAALLVCAWIVAFFPILSNTTLGLNATDPNLRDLMKLCGATRWQILIHLRLPQALPYFLAGLKVAGGLSLIGAVVAEFTAGTTSTGGSGLAFRILESSYRLDVPRMYAALALLSTSGVAIYAVISLISRAILNPWHESAERPE